MICVVEVTNQSIQGVSEKHWRFKVGRYSLDHQRNGSYYQEATQNYGGTLLDLENFIIDIVPAMIGYMPILGFANRKQAITLYLSFDIQANPLLKTIGSIYRG